MNYKHLKMYSSIRVKILILKANVQAIISSEEIADKVVLEIDQALNDLDVIDEWLVHYTLMLDGMGADVQQVETRNKNLQVASANQKVLLTYMEDTLVQMKYKINKLFFRDVLECQITFTRHLKMTHWMNLKELVRVKKQ